SVISPVRVGPIDSAEQIAVAVCPERSVIIVAAVGIVVIIVAGPEHVVEQVIERVGPEDRAEPDREHAAPEKVMVPAERVGMEGLVMMRERLVMIAQRLVMMAQRFVMIGRLVQRRFVRLRGMLPGVAEAVLRPVMGQRGMLGPMIRGRVDTRMAEMHRSGVAEMHRSGMNAAEVAASLAGLGQIGDQ